MTYLSISELGECMAVVDGDINRCNEMIKAHLSAMLASQEQVRNWIICREQHERAMERLIQRARGDYK